MAKNPTINILGLKQTRETMRHTLKYKNAYIHLVTENNKELATVQIFSGSDFYTKECKSFRAAQIFITKWFKFAK